MDGFLGTKITRTLSGVKRKTERYLARPLSLSNDSTCEFIDMRNRCRGGCRDVTGERVYAKALYYGPSSTPPYKVDWSTRMSQYREWQNMPHEFSKIMTDSGRGLRNNIYISLILKWTINCVDFAKMEEKEGNILFLI